MLVIFYHPIIKRLVTILNSQASGDQPVSVTPHPMLISKRKHNIPSEVRRYGKEGRNGNSFLINKAGHKEKSSESNRAYIGHLACDELKLKASLWFKASSRELLGCSDDENCKISTACYLRIS